MDKQWHVFLPKQHLQFGIRRANKLPFKPVSTISRQHRPLGQHFVHSLARCPSVAGHFHDSFFLSFEASSAHVCKSRQKWQCERFHQFMLASVSCYGWSVACIWLRVVLWFEHGLPSWLCTSLWLERDYWITAQSENCVIVHRTCQFKVDSGWTLHHVRNPAYHGYSPPAPSLWSVLDEIQQFLQEMLWRRKKSA